jgi:hypothetical protein
VTAVTRGVLGYSHRHGSSVERVYARPQEGCRQQAVAGEGFVVEVISPWDDGV